MPERTYQMLIDMHNHTEHGSQDSVIQIDQLIQIGKERGLDGACITEHQTITNLDLEELSMRYDFKLFGGIEMEIASIGHFLCYGDISALNEVSTAKIRQLLRQLCNELEYYPPTLSIEHFNESETFRRIIESFYINDIQSLIDKTHDAGGLIFWAHPYDNYSLLGIRFSEYIEKYKLLKLEDFYSYIQYNDSLLQAIIDQIDGFEVINGCDNERGMLNNLSARFAEMLNKLAIGGSDAHDPDDIGLVATRFNRTIENSADLVSALLARDIEPIITEYGQSITLQSRVYEQ